MLFNSLPFILGFLPLALAGYFFAAHRVGQRAAMAWMVLASLVFYGWWNPLLLPLLVATETVTFLIGRLLLVRRSRWVLAGGIVVNVGLLAWLKYANFLAGTVNAVAGTGFSLGDIVLPLGISFVTFQQIAYLVDVYHGQVPPMGFLRYNLFVVFFPHLIAGPIVHYRELMPQFADARSYRFDAENVSVGLTIFIVGLLKKVLLADPAGYYADLVFGAADERVQVSLVSAWFGVLAFSLQIYFDFSGYSDMAIGLSRMFNIRLPMNFNSPYRSASIIEFWRRWHMTLSRFLRDYIYVPLGGNRKGTLRRHANLMIVMLVGGLWHGAAWTFVAWGALHGAYLMVNHAWHWLRSRLGWRRGRGGWPMAVASWALTMAAVMVAWIFFRAQSWESAFILVKGVSGLGGVTLPESYLGRLGPLGSWLGAHGVVFGAGQDATIFPALHELGLVLAVAAVAVALPNTQEWLSRWHPTLDWPGGRVSWPAAVLVWRPGAWMGLVTALAAVVGLVAVLQANDSTFIYFQF